MASLNILRTVGNDKDILKSDEGHNMTHLFLMAYSQCPDKMNHEIGDVLVNEDSENKFALVVREGIEDRIITAALRVSILNLISMMIGEGKPVNTFLINRYQFFSKREETTFISTMREFLMTYYGEILTESVNLIISDYRE